jgi:hypothetical protein
VAFLHPFCECGGRFWIASSCKPLFIAGGGERVLWQSVSLLLGSAAKYPVHVVG